MFFGASSLGSLLSQLCQGRICSPVFCVDTPRSVSELWYEVDGTGVLLLGEVSEGPPQKLSAGKCALWYHLSPSVWAIKYTVSGTGLGLCLSHGNSGNQPVYALGIVFRKPPVHILWCRSDTETSALHTWTY